MNQLLVLAVSIAALALPMSASAVVPNFSVSSPTNGQHVRGSLSISAYSSNVDITATCSFTNVAPYSFGGDCTYMNRWVSVGYSLSPSLAEGSYQLTVTAKAADGSNQTTTINRTYVVDKTGPTVSFDSGPRFGNSYSGTDFSWTFSANESGSVVCKLDDEDWAACSSPYSRNGLADGAHTLRVHSTDDTYPSGNTGPDAVANFSVNNAPPIADFSDGPNSLTTDNTPTFNFSGGRDDALFSCQMDSGAWEDCESPYTADPALPDGAHTFSVRAYLAGPTDVQETPTAYTFTVDSTPPMPTIVSPPSAVGGSSATFEYSAGEEVDYYVCVLDPFGDDQYFSTCPTTFENLSAGEHQLLLAAVDLAGNWTPEDQAPVFTWTQYPNLPETTISSRPDPATAAQSASFKFSSPTGSLFECSIDGGAFAACPAEYTISGLAAGPHTLQVRAKDPAGQLDPSPDSAVFTLLAPPKPQVTSPKLGEKKLAITVSGAAAVSVKVEICKTKKVKGKKKTTCKKAAKGKASADAAGNITVKLSKKLKKKVKYRVTIVATDASGQKTTVVKTLKIK